MYTRIIERTLRSLLASPEILILYGPRRVGKTTLLQMLQRERLQENEPSAIYSLDDPTGKCLSFLLVISPGKLLVSTGQGE
jgi:predicted AAA+ superfamily ATPase